LRASPRTLVTVQNLPPPQEIQSCASPHPHRAHLLSGFHQFTVCFFFFIFYQSDKARVPRTFWINLMPCACCQMMAQRPCRVNIIIQKLHSKTWRFHFGTRPTQKRKKSSFYSFICLARGLEKLPRCETRQRRFHNHNFIPPLSAEKLCLCLV